MSPLDYSCSAYPVRQDLVDGHQRLLDHLVSPGTWWSGSQRRSIAEEARAARDCALCAERKAALSPFAVDGTHEGPATLDAEVVDVIHRIVTDPGRLARSWYEKVLANSVLDPEHYVELVAVTVHTNALDVFARAIGIDCQTLPPAGEGEPSRTRPMTARVEEAWVPQIPAGTEGGEDWRGLYGDAEFIPQIGRALSLVPAEIAVMYSISETHYMTLDHVGDPSYTQPGRALDRLQTELIASRVSAINECFY